MSRGFVKEDDQEEIPIVPPRADLPEGLINYVTRVGMEKLLAEKEDLIYERDHLDITDENERRIEYNHIQAILQQLENRIAVAKIVELNDQPQNEVRFGALVTLKIGNTSKRQKYQIVGVDEADISGGKISFLSPIARILINKEVGDKAILKLAKKERIFEIMDIVYPEVSTP